MLALLPFSLQLCLNPFFLPSFINFCLPRSWFSFTPSFKNLLSSLLPGSTSDPSNARQQQLPWNRGAREAACIHGRWWEQWIRQINAKILLLKACFHSFIWSLCFGIIAMLFPLIFFKETGTEFECVVSFLNCPCRHLCRTFHAVFAPVTWPSGCHAQVEIIFKKIGKYTHLTLNNTTLIKSHRSWLTPTNWQLWADSVKAHQKLLLVLSFWQFWFHGGGADVWNDFRIQFQRICRVHIWCRHDTDIYKKATQQISQNAKCPSFKGQWRQMKGRWGFFFSVPSDALRETRLLKQWQPVDSSQWHFILVTDHWSWGLKNDQSVVMYPLWCQPKRGDPHRVVIWPPNLTHIWPSSSLPALPTSWIFPSRSLLSSPLPPVPL